MPAQAEWSDEIQQEETEPEDILQKIDLSGIDDWDPRMQHEAWDLICEYACIFSWNHFDLGKTYIFKYSIKLTDPTLFKGTLPMHSIWYAWWSKDAYPRNDGCGCYLTLQQSVGQCCSIGTKERWKIKVLYWSKKIKCQNAKRYP